MARGRNDANAERGTIISQGISQKNTKREDKVKMKDRQGERERESDKDRRKERATASIASPWQPAPGWGRDKYGRGKRGRGRYIRASGERGGGQASLYWPNISIPAKRCQARGCYYPCNAERTAKRRRCQAEALGPSNFQVAPVWLPCGAQL